MEKKKLIVTTLVLVAAIAITLFLTKDYWWPFVYCVFFSPYYTPPCPFTPPYIPSGLEPETIAGAAGGYYIEIFFTPDNVSSEYPERWLADRNMLKGYARFYYTLENNQTIARLYIFEYDTKKTAERIYKKSGLVDEVDLGDITVKHGPNKYIFQSNEFIVYVSSAEGFEYVAKDKMMNIYVFIPE